MRQRRGSKNEENARQLAQKELAFMKDEIENLKMGSGSTVCSEASTGVGLGSGTFARPRPLSCRWNETFNPLKMKFKGSVTDYSKCSLQGITDEEITTNSRKWCRNRPKDGLIGTKPGRNKEHGLGKI